MEIKDLTQSSCREFLSELAGPAPVPGVFAKRTKFVYCL